MCQVNHANKHIVTCHKRFARIDTWLQKMPTFEVKLWTRTYWLHVLHPHYILFSSLLYSAANHIEPKRVHIKRYVMKGIPENCAPFILYTVQITTSILNLINNFYDLSIGKIISSNKLNRCVGHSYYFEKEPNVFITPHIRLRYEFESEPISQSDRVIKLIYAFRFDNSNLNHIPESRPIGFLD